MPLIRVSHYALLGVGRNASAQEIRRAYGERSRDLPRTGWRKLIRRVFTGECPETLLAARDTLLDAQRRARYDVELAEFRYLLPPPH